MSDRPEKKKRKLTTALKEAIGAHAQKSEENIEKPIALALISDESSALNLLNKIQASRRPQAVLEATLKICVEKQSEAHVGEAFLSIFRKHFAILGIDSAIACWKLLEEHLQTAESPNVSIACEFIGSTNLLGNGFGKLLESIKTGLPSAITSAWKNDRKVDSLALAYSLVSLLIAEDLYRDGQKSSKSPPEFWKEEVLTEKSMKKDVRMRMIGVLAGSEKIRDTFGEAEEFSEDQIEFLSKVFFNHLEFYAGVLPASSINQLLVKTIESHLEKGDWRSFLTRIRSAEVTIDTNVYNSFVSVLSTIFDVEFFTISNLETLKLKEVTKLLSAICEQSRTTKCSLSLKSTRKLSKLLDLLKKLVDGAEQERDSAAFSLLSINLHIVFDNEEVSEACEWILKKIPKAVLEKLVKAGKGLDEADEKVVKMLKRVKKFKEAESSASKFVNRAGSEVIGILETPDTSVAEAVTVLKGVHTLEAKKEVFDSIVKFVEEMTGAESLDEIKLLKVIIEMYGGGPLENLALQVTLSRFAADGWTEMDRSPGTEQSEESWFQVLVHVIDFMETVFKSAKSSILKSFTALYCQLFSQVLKNTQKFARNSANAVASRTLSPEDNEKWVLRRHKLIQDVARIIDWMKRNESYFSLLAASIIGDAVFYGSDSILAMAKLHSLADKNASAMLATNLPAVERTRYKKFLSTITRASKRVY